jgi:hypothetical protein
MLPSIIHLVLLAIMHPLQSLPTHAPEIIGHTAVIAVAACAAVSTASLDVERLRVHILQNSHNCK